MFNWLKKLTTNKCTTGQLAEPYDRDSTVSNKSMGKERHLSNTVLWTRMITHSNSIKIITNCSKAVHWDYGQYQQKWVPIQVQPLIFGIKIVTWQTIPNGKLFIGTVNQSWICKNVLTDVFSRMAMGNFDRGYVMIHFLLTFYRSCCQNLTKYAENRNFCHPIR